MPGELEKLRIAANCEGYGAIVDAILLCEREEWPPPPWAAGKVASLIRAAGDASGGKSVGKRQPGRNSNPVRAYYQRLIHYIRWDRVGELRSARHAEREQEDLARQKGDPELAAKLAQARAEWGPPLGKAREGIEFEVVAESLSGTAASGSGHAMRDSFRLVERATKQWAAGRGLEPGWRSFYMPTKEALELLGWEALWVAAHEGNSDFFNPLRRGKNQRNKPPAPAVD